jgi:undecaprenyl-diphosphatase
VTFALRVVPGVTRRSLVIAAGIVLTALIGLTRVYLRVHWLSDVSSGWALGVSCYALAAAVVLVIAHIRDNPPRDAAPEPDRGAGAGARD